MLRSHFVGPASGPTNEIEAFRDEVRYWSSIADSQAVSDFYAYIQRYPTGFFAEQAQAQSERLAADAPVRPIGGQRRVVVPTDRPLFALGDRFVYRSSDVFGKAPPPRDLRVTRVARDTVELNDGAEVWDWVGNLIVDEVSGRIVRSPAKIWMPSELYVGKRWRTAYARFVAIAGRRLRGLSRDAAGCRTSASTRLTTERIRCAAARSP
jgi:hypothetical protein